MPSGILSDQQRAFIEKFVVGGNRFKDLAYLKKK